MNHWSFGVLGATIAIVFMAACSADPGSRCLGEGCTDATSRTDVERPDGAGGRPEPGRDGESSDGSGSDDTDEGTGDSDDAGAADGDDPEPGDGSTDACEPFPEICNGRDDDCDGAVDEGDGGACVDACCDPALACQAGSCELIPCDGMRCGDGSLCCSAPTVCWRDACFLPEERCEFTADCSTGLFCEPDLGQCVPAAGLSECEYIPPPGTFEPVIGCRWTSAGLPFPDRQDVVATPIVLNLTDDNGDGVTDRNDIPDIAFLTYNFSQGCCNELATLRIVSGQCGPDGSMRTIASISDPPLTNDSGIAAADLNGDGVPELVAITRVGGNGADRPQGTIAFIRTAPDGSTWGTLWHNTSLPTWNVHTRGGATISVANVDAAGAPEVVIGPVVLGGADGLVVWDGYANSGNTGGRGNNAFLGPAGTVADINLDGLQEVIAGNSVYSSVGAVLWTFNYTSSNSACGGNLPCDGYNAVANFDDDAEGEVVSIRQGEVFIWNHDGTQLWKARIPVDNCANNESGPPTVADFDGDGVAEIGTASSDFYVVLDRNTCGNADWAAAGCEERDILWKRANNDCSSRSTGSSVFDFDGDGRAEVVYADEDAFRIFDGPTGEILFEDATFGSHTRIEMPIIVDVDNDGNAEVIVPENRSGGGTAGLEVWEDALDNWVRTRRIWNQHGYSITHVTEDGQVPVRPTPNWLDSRLNNFRQNVQADNLFAAPDLALTDLDVATDGGKCPFEVTLQIQATLRNLGSLSVAAGVPIVIDVLKDGAVVYSETFLTTTRLFPGTIEVLAFTPSVAEGLLVPPLTVVGRIDPDNAISECDEANNSVRVDDVVCL
jgi:hypothetical protein